MTKTGDSPLGTDAGSLGAGKKPSVLKAVQKVGVLPGGGTQVSGLSWLCHQAMIFKPYNYLGEGKTHQSSRSPLKMCSPGIFQCGPSPLIAVRQGDVYLPYDTKFVYAEVNADKVYWLVKKVDGEDKFFRLSTETQGIGVNISTKAVGENERRDITWEYKYPEGDCPLLHSSAGEPWLSRSPHRGKTAGVAAATNSARSELLLSISVPTVTPIGCSSGTNVSLWARKQVG